MKIIAIIGSYRKGGMTENTVDEILAAARDAGAETEKIHLIDAHIEFCRNCRTCTQVEGPQRGECVIEDDMKPLLAAVDAANALVLASPINFGSVTALTKRFMERLVCTAYWPWGAGAPKIRNPRKDKPAVLVSSSAAPAILSRPSTRTVRSLKETAGVLGFYPMGVLFMGLAAMRQSPRLSDRARKRACMLGAKLVAKARQKQKHAR